MWIVNGQVINRQKDFTDGNGQRRRGAVLVKWSKEALAEIGVKPFHEAQITEGYKSTGYTDSEDVNGTVVRTHTTEPKDTVADAKANRVEELNAIARDLLNQTDYYVIRKAEKGTPIPADIAAERDQIRADILTNEASINATSKYDDIVKHKPVFDKLKKVVI